MIDSFSCIYVLQGSVATELTCGGILDNCLWLIVYRMHR